MDDLRDASVEVTLALGRVQSCIRPVAAAVELLALMKSADRLPDHVNALEAL